jgi:hypothetical protein
MKMNENPQTKAAADWLTLKLANGPVDYGDLNRARPPTFTLIEMCNGLAQLGGHRIPGSNLWTLPANAKATAPSTVSARAAGAAEETAAQYGTRIATQWTGRAKVKASTTADAGTNEDGEGTKAAAGRRIAGYANKANQAKHNIRQERTKP